MNSFEQEKQSESVANEPGENSRVYEVSDQESTIFSDPKAHKDKVKKGKNLKKIIPASVALVLVGAIIALIVTLIPPIVDNEDSSSSLDDIRIMEESLFDKVDRVTLIAENNTIKFHTIDAPTEEKTTTQWSLVDVDPSLTSVSNIENTIFGFMEQGYSKKISDDKNDGKEYGFDKPKYQVDFFNEGSDSVSFSLIIGGYSPTDSGRYATTTLSDEVYFVRDTGFYHYQKNKLDFVEPERIPAIAKDQSYSDDNYTEGTLILCDKLTLSGKTFGDTYKIICKKTDNITVFNNYHIVSPTTRPADDNNIAAIVGLFAYGVESNGCYSYTATEKDIKKFGLDSPDFSVRIQVGDIEDGFSATLQKDGFYAVYYKGNKTIMKVDATALAPAQFAPKDLYNELLFIENITSAANVKIESGDKSVKFDISTTYDETSGRDTISTVKVNKTAVETRNFQNYYSYIIAIKAQTYNEADVSGKKPATVLTINHNNGTAPTVIKYYEAGPSRYQVVVNGVKMGQISSADHTRIMKYALNVAEGKTYNSR